MWEGRRGFGHNNDLAVVLIVIAVLAAIAIPTLLNYQKARRAKCLTNIAALADGTLPPGATCPAGGKPYAVTTRDGLEVAACPEPAGHLDTAPHLVREKPGPWAFRQTLPAPSADGLGLIAGRVTSESADAVHIAVIPAFWIRWIMMPILSLVCLLVTLGCLYGTWVMAREKSWGGAVTAFVVAVLFGFFAVGCVTTAASSTEFRLERDGARLTRIHYLFGSKTSEEIHAGCLAIVPAIGMASDQRSLVVLHPPDAQGARQTTIGQISEKSLGAAARLDRLLAGR